MVQMLAFSQSRVSAKVCNSFADRQACRTALDLLKALRPIIEKQSNALKVYNVHLVNDWCQSASGPISGGDTIVKVSGAPGVEIQSHVEAVHLINLGRAPSNRSGYPAAPGANFPKPPSMK